MLSRMDPDHLAHWFDARRPHLHALARRIVGTRADAEDVVQDAFLKALAGLGDAIRSPAAWMTATVRNLALDHLRHRRVVEQFAARDDTDDRGPLSPVPSVEDGLARTLEAAAAVMRIVRLLDEPEAAAMLLQIVFDEDHATLARRTGRSTGAMRVALHRAHLRVRATKNGEQDRRKAADEERVAQTFAVCWQAIEARDATLLHPLLGGDPSAMAGVGSGSASGGACTPPVRVSTIHRDSRYRLALRQGDHLICVLPIGVVPDERPLAVD